MKVNLPVEEGTELFFILYRDNEFIVEKKKDWVWKRENQNYIIKRIIMFQYSDDIILSTHKLGYNVFTDEESAKGTAKELNDMRQEIFSVACPTCNTNVVFNCLEELENVVWTDHSAFFDCPVCGERFQIDFEKAKEYNSDKATIKRMICFEQK